LAEDRELWERSRQGDGRAFEALYLKYAPKLEVFLRQVLGNQQAAQDVMQETFTQIWQRPNGFEPERGTLRAYVFGAGRKRAAEWWRRQGAPSGAVLNEPSKCTTETASLVSDAFAQLREDQRELLWLREVEGQSYSELAEILEIPVGTVRSRLSAAREELRRIWQAAPKLKEGDA